MARSPICDRANDVIAERIGVQGWSNGGMTVLSAMDSATRALKEPTRENGFRAALALYPACRTQDRQAGYKPYAPLLILSAADDDEVSPQVCRRVAEATRVRGAPVEFVLYEGAHHSYDDPGKTKQSHAPNRTAMLDSLRRAEAFFEAASQSANENARQEPGIVARGRAVCVVLLRRVAARIQPQRNRPLRSRRRIRSRPPPAARSSNAAAMHSTLRLRSRLRSPWSSRIRPVSAAAVFSCCIAPPMGGK